jgi:hypothetical protein
MTDKALFHESGDLIIKASNIDFNSFDLQLDEVMELDRFGYYKWEYVNNQINSLLIERLGREEKGSQAFHFITNVFEELFQLSISLVYAHCHVEALPA